LSSEKRSTLKKKNTINNQKEVSSLNNQKEINSLKRKTPNNLILNPKEKPKTVPAL
jgi:hypothetical protein